MHRPLARSLRATLFSAALLAASVCAATDLQLSYDVGSKQSDAAARTPPEPVARALIEADTPLRLEYELTKRVEHMTQTTQELRAIVESMPGPGLGPDDTQPPPPQKFASPLDETLTRLNHVEQLVADISRIIEAMPLSGTAVKAPATSVPVVKAAAPSPKRAPVPAPTEETPLAITTTRAVLLICGGLVAAILARHLRRMYMRRRPTAKQLAATIEPPPLKDEAIELADVMASMGLADGAAQALVQSIQANPRQSLSHWLKLLDVYRQTGQQKQFEEATEKIRSSFNVKPGSWDDKDGSAERKTSLESYPHIAAQLKKLWPKPECTEYLLSLLADNREGKRAGFPLSVVEEIVLLLSVLRSEQE